MPEQVRVILLENFSSYAEFLAHCYASKPPGHSAVTMRYKSRPNFLIVRSFVVFGRHNPFLRPPATLNPKNKLSTFVHDTLHTSVLIQRKVITLLDGLEGMDQGSRIANDQVLMTLSERLRASGPLSLGGLNQPFQ